MPDTISRRPDEIGVMGCILKAVRAKLLPLTAALGLAACTIQNAQLDHPDSDSYEHEVDRDNIWGNCHKDNILETDLNSREAQIDSCGLLATTKLEAAKNGEEFSTALNTINHLLEATLETNSHYKYDDLLKKYEEVILGLMQNPDIKLERFEDLLNRLLIINKYSLRHALVTEKIASALLNILDTYLESGVEPDQEVAKNYIPDLLFHALKYKNAGEVEITDDYMALMLGDQNTEQWLHATHHLYELVESKKMPEAYLERFESLLIEHANQKNNETFGSTLIYLAKLSNHSQLKEGQQFIIDCLQNANSDVSLAASRALFNTIPNAIRLNAALKKELAIFNFGRAKDLHSKLAADPIDYLKEDNYARLSKYNDDLNTMCAHYEHAIAFDYSIFDAVIQSDCKRWKAEWSQHGTHHTL